VNTLSYKTVSISKEAAIANREWFVLDLEGQVVGRAATLIASILRGKHKPTYTPHTDCGDYVILLNADKVRFTGKKMTDKQYLRYTGYPGGQRSRTPLQTLKTFPERIIESAVRGMLPKNILGRAMFKKMFVYAGAEHPHHAQKPKTIEL
jgi:large subunit ribosomal protein L13